MIYFIYIVFSFPKPPYKKNINNRKQNTLRLELLIAGIDPGTRSAFTLLDLDGNLIEIKSFRNVSLDKLISEISKKGKIFLIGTDVIPCPLAVQKIAKKLGSKIIIPDHNLTYLEKIKIADTYLKKQKQRIKIENKHEKDSLVSALYTYKRIKPLLKKINDAVKQHNLEKYEKEIRKEVLLKNKPISSVIKEFKQQNSHHSPSSS